MEILRGEGVSSGIAFGIIHFSGKERSHAEKRIVEDWQGETVRYEKAREKATGELEKLYAQTLEKLGEENAQLFEIHRMMLEDPDFSGCITEMIRKEHVNAECAVEAAAHRFSDLFSSMEDEYMQGRAADVKDISHRLLRILENGSDETAGPEKQQGAVILAGDDFTPSETAQLDTTHVCALLTQEGSRNSHTAIFARTMGIPAVIGLGELLQPQLEGMDCIADGFTGEVLLSPTAETKAAYLEKQQKELEHRHGLEAYRNRESITKEGRRLPVCANIGGPRDLAAALKNGAEGVGLFRSEFLYLERPDFPSEEEQFRAYREAAAAMEGKRVVIRTLDIGADKQAEYFHLPKEENPALGMRAIRLCLTRPEIFRTQLRALCRASAFGKIAVMFPMITSLDELRRAKALTQNIQKELAAEHIPFDEKMELGIMIETPAAAIISDLLAKEADFFSIGTNDLIQYTYPLAADRQNRSISSFCDPHHEAVMRLIRLTCKHARENKIWVGVCGELAADPSLTTEFLSLGIDELSVAPPSILPIRAAVCESGPLPLQPPT